MTINLHAHCAPLSRWLLVGIAGLWLTLPFSADACTAFNGTEVNRSVEEDGDAIIGLIQDGCDPPPGWLCRGSGFCEVPTSKMLGNVNNTILKANRPQVRYNNKNGGCNSYDDTKPGGAFHDGGISSCDAGRGYGAFSLPNIQPNIFEALDINVRCLTNLFANMSGYRKTGTISDDGFGGSFSSPGVSANANVSGNCASGSIGICGLGTLGGSVCDNGDAETVSDGDNGPYARSEEPSYVEMYDVASYDYAYNEITEMSSIYLPRGGTAYYTNPNGQRSFVTVRPGGYVTFDDQNMAYVGPNNNPANPIDLSFDPSAVPTIEVIPRGGRIQLDEQLFTGETMDVPGETTTYTTNSYDDAVYAPLNQTGNVTVNTTPNDGAVTWEEVPDAERIYPDGDGAGSFPPGEMSVDLAAENVNAAGNIANNNNQ